MRSAATIVSLLFAAALLQPAVAAAQERVEQFESASLAGESVPTEFGPPRSAYTASAGGRAVPGVIAGGLTGLALGAGLGYLLYSDSTAGCDDGICGWVPPMMVGGATGLVLGGWIGYRIAVGPHRK